MKLSVIIPCYNESNDIIKNSERVLKKLSSLPIEYEVLLVNDGSKDQTKNTISLIKGVKPLSYEPNRGKGGAVKYGIENSTGDYCLFMDADLSTDLSAIDTLLPLLEKYDMIIGSRHHNDSKIPIKQPLKRRFIGRCCRFLVNKKLGFKYSDTQCGFKCIKSNIAKQMTKRQIINGFAFDVEYLYIAKLNNVSVIEIPIIWRDDRSSTVSPIKSSIKFFKDLKVVKKNKQNYFFK